jgi:hypothetical protein
LKDADLSNSLQTAWWNSKWWFFRIPAVLPDAKRLVAPYKPAPAGFFVPKRAQIAQ